MAWKLLLPGFVVGLTFSVLGCSGDDETDSSPTPAAETEEATLGPTETDVSAEFRAAAEAAVEEAVLTIDDAPEGWSSSPPEEDDTSFEGIEFTGDCVYFQSEESYPGSVAEAESDDLEGPSSQQVSSDAAAYESEGELQDSLDEYLRLLDMCRDQLKTAFEQAFTQALQEDDPTAEVTVVINETFVEHEFEDIGGTATRALRTTADVTLDGEAVTLVIESVIFVEERMAAGLEYLVAGAIDSAEVSEIATVVADKLVAAEANLPD